MRRPLLAGNWKMNGTPADSAELARGLARALVDLPAVDVAVFPPFLSIPAVVKALQGVDVVVGGQDLHTEASGAYTGNVSGEMLKAAGCGMALIGHSERRQYEGEAGELLRRKVLAAFRAGLTPVLCCGETLEVRDAGRTLDVVRGQLAEALDGLTGQQVERVVLAYEPVWAIGTGRTASPEQAQEVHAAIRAWVGNAWDAGTARATRILYGGSVKPSNVVGIMAQPDVDGALVGGASLEVDLFEPIIRFQS